MTRLLITGDPDAAHPTKNATAPGLPHQTRTHMKGRTPMVETTGPAAVSAAREDAVRALRSAEDAVNAWLDLVQAEAEARGGDPLCDQAYRAGLRLWSAVVATGHDFATRSAATEAGEDR